MDLDIASPRRTDQPEEPIMGTPDSSRKSLLGLFLDGLVDTMDTLGTTLADIIVSDELCTGPDLLRYTPEAVDRVHARYRKLNKQKSQSVEQLTAVDYLELRALELLVTPGRVGICKCTVADFQPGGDDRVLDAAWERLTALLTEQPA